MKQKPRQLKVCAITGIETVEDNFYKGQNHVKAVDNLRRLTGATREQLTRTFNQIKNY